MVVFVDLDEPERPQTSTSTDLHLANHGDLHHVNLNHADFGALTLNNHHLTTPVGEPLFFNRATEALACYPIIIVVASFLDLNSLDSLAQTCRQARASLLAHRSLLMRAALRCVNEPMPIGNERTFLFRARARDHWVSAATVARRDAPKSKPFPCARDMVGECRKCGVVVCRNCTIKPPSHSSLSERHRRLCQACVKAPLATLVKPPLPPNTPADSDAVKRAVCRCESEGVYLCLDCGRSIKAADHDYFRLWKWRIQYGEVLGGLGTGIGDGDRGVVCAREQDCCQAREQEQEMDSAAEDARTQTPAISGVGSNVLTVSLGRSPSPSATDPGYERHEIQGIGGVLKKKLSRMVRVGACVPECEDERARRVPVLEREVRGEVRSWCGWCNRPVGGGGL